MKKTWILLLISLLGLGLFSACTSNADTLPSPSPSASAMPSASPMATQSPTVSLSPAATDEPAATGVNSIEDARRLSDDVAEEVEKLSELDTADAIVAGNIALIGIRYDTQYQGGLTERLTEMVKTRVETIDKTITAVQVTDDETMMDKIAQLHEKLNGDDITFEELQTQVLEIAGSITGGGDAAVTEPSATTGA